MYKQGALNKVADALSRCHSPAIMVVSLCNPDWVEKVKLGYQDDAQAMEILNNPFGDFTCQDGLIRHQGRV